MSMRLETRRRVTILACVAALVVVEGCASSRPRHVVMLPGILLDQGTRELRIDGEICIERGFWSTSPWRLGARSTKACSPCIVAPRISRLRC